jgi:hypothetical protein
VAVPLTLLHSTDELPAMEFMPSDSPFRPICEDMEMEISTDY